MGITYLNSLLSQNASGEKDILSSILQNSGKHNQIHEGMTSIEISEVVSDKVISIIKEQFESAKKEYQEKGIK